jgi:peptide-methionine (R)-S-oxide reductase
MPIPFLSSLFSSSNTPAKMTNFPVQKTDQEWQAMLSPEQFRVIRQKGTEAAFTGEYDKHMPTEGTYNCAACDAPLYTAQHKFKSGCGWPAFFDAVPGAVEQHTDRSFGMARTEIVCAKCGGHLGHVFAVNILKRLLLHRYINPFAQGEGYKTPTDERHCVNSVSIKFNKDDKVIDKTDSGAVAAKV